MLFHFLNFSQCVVCMFGHKTIYKVTNLEVHSKGRYFVFKKSLFKNYSEQLVWTTKLFSSICDITNCKSRLLKFDWLAGGENTWLSFALYFWWKPTFFRKIWMSFSFHLAYNVWKSSICERRSVLCTALPGKSRSLPLQQRLPLADN